MKNIEFPATELEARGYKKGDTIYLKAVYEGLAYNGKDIKVNFGKKDDTNYISVDTTSVLSPPVCLRSGDIYLINGHKCLVVMFEGFVHCISDSGYAALLEEDDNIKPWPVPVVEEKLSQINEVLETPIDPF